MSAIFQVTVKYMVSCLQKKRSNASKSFFAECYTSLIHWLLS